MLNNAEETPKPGERCDLCGGDLMIVNAVSDDFGSFSICVGCAELWTTYLMHHPAARRSRPMEECDADAYRSKSAG